MTRKLHHRKSDNKYALWSTILDDYITPFIDKEELRKVWLDEKVKEDKEQIDKWMEEIDVEV